jgi:ribonuclease D
LNDKRPSQQQRKKPASTGKKNNPYLIDTPAAFNTLIKHLLAQPRIGVDTESNSMYAYRGSVCLIQVSTVDGEWLIDPFALTDLAPLNKVMASPDVEKIFHACEYDVMSLRHDYGFTFNNLFDTMWAARLLGRKPLSLANLMEEFFQIAPDKSYQRANWGVRPLPQDQQDYARQDVRYLLPLRDHLWKEIETAGQVEESLETFAYLCNVQASDNAFDPEGYWEMRNVRKLSRRSQAILREIYALRDTIARTRNAPVFKVMNDDVLIEVASRGPESMEELQVIRGVSVDFWPKYGQEFLYRIKKGIHAAPPRPPSTNSVNRIVSERQNTIRQWRQQKAQERGVESDVIIPREAMLALAAQNPQKLEELDKIPGLGPWRRARYGEELITLLTGLYKKYKTQVE